MTRWWLTGPKETGEADRQSHRCRVNNKLGARGGPKPGEGPSKEERETGHYDLLFVGYCTRRAAGEGRRNR